MSHTHTHLKAALSGLIRIDRNRNPCVLIIVSNQVREENLVAHEQVRNMPTPALLRIPSSLAAACSFKINAKKSYAHVRVENSAVDEDLCS